MKSSISNYIIPIAIGALALLIGYGVFTSFATPQKDPKVKAEEERIKKELDLAEAKIEWETAKLNNLYLEAADTNPFFTAIQAQYSNVSKAVDSTDALFKDADTKKPEINIKTTKEITDDINDRRAVINVLMEDWKEKTTLTLAKTLDQVAIVQVIKDAEIIQAYVEELAQIVSALTPENSGLPQSQIDIYETVVQNATSQINSAVIALVEAQTPVTQTEIQTQVEAVEAAQQDVVVLEAELSQIQNPTPTPIPPPVVIPPVTPDPAPVVEPPVVVVPPPPPVSTTTKPAKPKLIQGANLVF